MLHDIIAIEPELNRLDISQSTLSGLTGIPAGSLSDIVRGVKKPGFDQEREIYRWLEGLNKLIEAVKPLQLDFKKTLQLRQQIELVNAGRLQIVVAVQEERPAEQTYFNVYIANAYGYFQERRLNTITGKFEIVPAKHLGAAAAMTRDVAEKIQKALAGIGGKAQVLPGRNKGADSPVEDSFESIWKETEEVKVQQ